MSRRRPQTVTSTARPIQCDGVVRDVRALRGRCTRTVAHRGMFAAEGWQDANAHDGQGRVFCPEHRLAFLDDELGVAAAPSLSHATFRQKLERDLEEIVAAAYKRLGLPRYGPVAVASRPPLRVSRALLENNHADVLALVDAQRRADEVERVRRDEPFGWLQYPLTIGEAQERGLL